MPSCMIKYTCTDCMEHIDVTVEYDDMGDHLLKALIVHARALEDQLRYVVCSQMNSFTPQTCYSW